MSCPGDAIECNYEAALGQAEERAERLRDALESLRVKLQATAGLGRYNDRMVHMSHLEKLADEVQAVLDADD